MRTCHACPTDSGCVECDALDICTKCERKYQLNIQNQCERCDFSCAHCENDQCLECIDDWYMDQSIAVAAAGSEGECVKECPKKTFVQVIRSANHCVDCPAGCSECESLKLCGACDKGYEITNDLCT
jgi:hypothetical protein